MISCLEKKFLNMCANDQNFIYYKTEGVIVRLVKFKFSQTTGYNICFIRLEFCSWYKSEY